jgi:hypothetical protein
MKTKTFTPMGALHPVLFFAGVYVVVLLFSIFICSALFYSCNTTSANTSSAYNEQQPVQKTQPANANAATAAVAFH